MTTFEEMHWDDSPVRISPQFDVQVLDALDEDTVLLEDDGADIDSLLLHEDDPARTVFGDDWHLDSLPRRNLDDDIDLPLEDESSPSDYFSHMWTPESSQSDTLEVHPFYAIDLLLTIPQTPASSQDSIFLSAASVNEKASVFWAGDSTDADCSGFLCLADVPTPYIPLDDDALLDSLTDDETSAALCPESRPVSCADVLFPDCSDDIVSIFSDSYEPPDRRSVVDPSESSPQVDYEDSAFHFGLISYPLDTELRLSEDSDELIYPPGTAQHCEAAHEEFVW